MIIYEDISRSSLIKNLRYLLLRNFCLFILISCLFIQAKSFHFQSNQDWIILPNLVNPYTEPSLKAEKSEVVFKYMELIREIKQPENEAISDWVCFECEGQELYLPQALLVQSVRLSSTISLQDVDKFNPLPLTYRPKDLLELDQKWNFHASDYPKHLRSEAAEALDKMLQEAQETGIHLRVFSAFRSSEKQRTLYLNAIEEQGLKQEWVAKPGHSEHQLGTTVDLSNPNPRSVGHQSFGLSKEGQWLQAHAEQYGFKQSYTPDNVRFTGYQSEPWHYRYRGLNN